MNADVDGSGDRMIAAYFDRRVVPEGVVTAFPLAKLGLLADLWAANPHVEMRRPAPVGADDLKLVHDAAHVDDMLAGRKRNPITGFDPSGTMAALLDVGGFVAAARHAVATGMPAAVIGGGFHHAGPSRSHAFGTFNGLMVAAALLLRERAVRRVAVLDLDFHFGDGTQAILARMGLDWPVGHYSLSREMLEPGEVEEWLGRLPSIIEGLHAEGAAVIFYNAGVDPHVDDPMVRGYMTTDQIRRREEIVFGTCARLALPIAWTTAGGYQRDMAVSVSLHDLAMRAAIGAFGRG